MVNTPNNQLNKNGFKHITLIGCGLIGSSIARGIQQYNLSETLTVIEKDDDLCKRVHDLHIADNVTTDFSKTISEADLVILCTPVRSFAEITKKIAPLLKEGAVVSDVGSVKKHVVESVLPFIPDHAYLVPGHPIAGTENSGPEAGFSHLFHDRWFVMTPLKQFSDNENYTRAKQKLTQLWTGLGSNVEEMDPAHHDKVLAITSHLPHLIAYTIVSTATDLEDDLKEEVIKFSASGFRDFTRIAASDPVMWRDIFMTNKDAVLDIMQRFNEDLTTLQKAIRRENGDALHDAFARTRAIRRSVIEHGQAVPEEYKNIKS